MVGLRNTLTCSGVCAHAQPEPAPSTVTVPATQYWSVIEGDRRQLSDYEPSERAAGRTTSLQRTGSQTGSKNLLARQLSGARPQQEEGAPMHLLPASPEGIREEVIHWDGAWPMPQIHLAAAATAPGRIPGGVVKDDYCSMISTG